MSAYIVENNVINFLIAAAIKYQVYVKVPKIDGRNSDYAYKEVNKFEPEELDALGQVLLDENYRSVNARYRESDKAEKFVFGRSKTDRNAGFSKIELAQVFATVANYEYQASETDDFEASEAYSFTSRLVRKAGESLRTQDENGDFTDTIWGAPEPDITIKPLYEPRFKDFLKKSEWH